MWRNNLSKNARLCLSVLCVCISIPRITLTDLNFGRCFAYDMRVFGAKIHVLLAGHVMDCLLLLPL